MAGTMSRDEIAYCPHCQAVLSDGLSEEYRARIVEARCGRCGARAIFWPGDLPLPTRANVRALWGFARSQPQAHTPRLTLITKGPEQRPPGPNAPESNPRGRWNG